MENNKPDCRNHFRDLFGKHDMKVVAEAIGDLHYETLGELIGRLSTKLYKDGLRDRCSGREELGYALDDASEHLNKATQKIMKAWQISKPFMKQGK